MDATVKLILGEGGCRHVTAEITIGGETRQVVKLRDEWLDESGEPESRFAVVEANLRTYLKTENAALSESGKSLDWSVASAAVKAKVFKI